MSFKCYTIKVQSLSVKQELNTSASTPGTYFVTCEFLQPCISFMWVSEKTNGVVFGIERVYSSEKWDGGFG